MAVRDTFAGASLSTADTGQAWVLEQVGPFAGPPTFPPAGAVASSFNVSGGKAAGGNANYVNIATVEHGAADLTIEVDVEVPDPGVGNGVVFRHVDEDNYWLAFLYTSINVGNPNAVFVSKVLAGAWTDEGVAVIAPLSGDQTLRIELAGPQVDVTLVGVGLEYSSVETDHQSATKHGILTYFDTDYRLLAYRADWGGWQVGSVAF